MEGHEGAGDAACLPVRSHVATHLSFSGRSSDLAPLHRERGISHWHHHQPHPTLSTPFPGWRQKVKAKCGCSQHCPVWELCLSRSSEQAVMGSLVCRSSRGCWGCGVLGWVTNEEPILLFLDPAQEFGHYQDGTCLGHQGAEASIELKFGGHLWI